ncbi:hypothetical protein SAMN05421837_11342 [Amycolatopsis pretoriensis]|uniref:Uncharacterized protein n=2 Tax=Amycolatopsis pretoriensis TaxID=218821 RepID=A0A1H5RGK7_9PSEU|nr:hypothetical protein SAMN05421837_11342 [Amycolatopsis pretoriensis]
MSGIRFLSWVAAWLDGMSGGFGFPFGCVAAVVAVVPADLAGATAHPWYALVTLGPVVLLTVFWSSVTAAIGVAVVAWALDSGFVLGRAGELSFDAASALAAAVLGAAVVLGFLARRRPRVPVWVPTPRRPAEVAIRRPDLTGVG